jgi:alanine racemase
MSHSPRAFIEVNLSAIDHNIKVAKKKIQQHGQSSEILAVVKANAYGHGLIPVAQQALASGATWLGVALLEEAFELRSAGITAPIIAWLTPPGEDFVRAIEENIDLAFSSPLLLQEIEEAGKLAGKKPRVHIEIDTGMIRGGLLFESDEYGDQWREVITYLPTVQVEVVGAWTHFARADEPERSETAQQVSKFNAAIEELKNAGINPKYIHLSNSAGVFTHAESEGNIVRLGIAMYGLNPDSTHDTLIDKCSDLRPALSLFAKVHLVKKVKAGSHIGYGGLGVAEIDTHIALIPVGYSDGLSRRTDSTVGAWINGELAPIIGRVSMDQCVIDLGPTPAVQAGEYVALISPDGCNADRWAAAAGTINYEVVTRLPVRLPRKYVSA